MEPWRAIRLSGVVRVNRGVVGLLTTVALAACSPAEVRVPPDAGRDATGTGGAKIGPGGPGGTGGTVGTGGTTSTGGATGAGGSGGAKDAAPSTTGDALPDLPSAPDLAKSTDLPDAADAPAMLDAPVDRTIGGADALPSIDGSTEAATPAGPTTYYISTTGSDQAVGTLAAPFKTIQHCATLARPGDTCAIRAGTYRETVTPARSGTAEAHITFAPYLGECVTISGADVLTATWQPYQGSIYMADTSLRFIQLFANGKMLNEARWPNADPDDLVHMPFAQAGPNTTPTTLEGPTLPAGDWTGAYVFTIPGRRWVGYTRKIESYNQAKKIVTWTEVIPDADSGTSTSYLPALQPGSGDTFHVFGSLLALDAAGEWYQDPATGKVYLWAPGSVAPSTLKIEVKQRDYGFNLGARSYVGIKGVRLFSTSIRMAGSSHCVVDGVHARYVSHLREVSGYGTGFGSKTWNPTGSGVVVNVSNPGGSALRLNLSGPNGGTDPNDRWCAILRTFDQPVFIPWSGFNTACWNSSGTAYAGQPLVNITASVSGGTSAAIPYNFCINGIAVQTDEASSIENPLWSVKAGGRVATSTWQGNAYAAFGGTGTTMTPTDLTKLPAGGPLCASGSVAATTDYSGWATLGFTLNDGWSSSTGPALDGDFNEWKNGSIAYAAAEGIIVDGSDNKIANNVIHDVSYMGLDIGGITTADGSHRTLISGNSLSRSGSKGIRLHGSAEQVLKNRVSQVMLQNDDGGLIYSWNTDGGGSEVAYNDLSDNQTVYAAGVYLDDGTHGFIVHHNWVHDTAWTGISFKSSNQIFNNTILGTPTGAASIYLNQNTNVWEDLSTAVFSNNLIQQRPGVTFTVTQQQTTDYGDYEAGPIQVTPDWQKVTVPFASLHQPPGVIRESFDTTNITGLTWRVLDQGTYEIDIDDIWLEGPTPKLVDDFESGTANYLGGGWWSSNSNGSTATKGSVTGFSGKGLSLAGNMVAAGSAQVGTGLAPSGSPVDLTSYTGISFRIRGTATLNLSNGSASTTPIQQRNLDCPVDASGVPTTSCPVDQGGLFSPYTDGYSGAAPDVGAFESGQPPWTAGSTTVEPTDLCL